MAESARFPFWDMEDSLGSYLGEIAHSKPLSAAELESALKELGDIDERSEEIKEFKKKILEVKMPEKVQKEAEKQLKRLEKMHPDSAEAGTVRTYLEWMVELPWSKQTKNNLYI